MSILEIVGAYCLLAIAFVFLFLLLRLWRLTSRWLINRYLPEDENE